MWFIHVYFELCKERFLNQIGYRFIKGQVTLKSKSICSGGTVRVRRIVCYVN